VQYEDFLCFETEMSRQALVSASTSFPDPYSRI